MCPPPFFPPPAHYESHKTKTQGVNVNFLVYDSYSAPWFRTKSTSLKSIAKCYPPGIGAGALRPDLQPVWHAVDCCACRVFKLTEEGPSVTGALASIGTNSAGTVAAEGPEHAFARSLTLLDVILLLVALCFHAFFEGLAVGLATTTFDVWNLTLSICLNEVRTSTLHHVAFLQGLSLHSAVSRCAPMLCAPRWSGPSCLAPRSHKASLLRMPCTVQFFEGLALGTTLRAQDVKRHAFNFLLYALGASIVAPVGIIVGLVLESSISHDASEWAEGVGNGLAAGVFICIATRHVIAKAMVPNGPNEPFWVPLLKFFVSGLGLMTNALTTLRTE